MKIKFGAFVYKTQNRVCSIRCFEFYQRGHHLQNENEVLYIHMQYKAYILKVVNHLTHVLLYAINNV